MSRAILEGVDFTSSSVPPELLILEPLMSSSAVDFPRQEPVPHRWHVLKILRAMRSGHPFIRLLDVSCLMYLEGVPLAVHFFGFLERNGYIAPRATEGLQAHYYILTCDGIVLYEEGERWWRSLGWEQKLWVIVRG